MKNKSYSQVLLVVSMAVLLVFFTSTIWEFLIEQYMPLSFSDGPEESSEERWQLVAVSTLSAVAALAVLVPLIYRIIKEHDQFYSRFDTALANMSQGLCMFDDEQRLIVCNERYATMYGLSPEQVKPGTTFREIRECRVANGLHDGSPEEYIKERINWVRDSAHAKEVRHLNDGRSIEVTHQAMSDGGWVATHEDVTKLKMAEEELRRSETLFRAFVNNSPSAISMKGLDSTYLLVNAKHAEFFGRNINDVIGEKPRNLFNKKYVKANLSHDNAVLEADRALELEEEVQVEGRTKTLLTLKFPIADVSGEVMGVGAIATDITDRKEADKALRKQNELFNSALANMSQGLCMFDDEQRLIVCNERWAIMYGLSPEQVRPGTTLRQTLESRVANGMHAGSPEEYIESVSNWIRGRSYAKKTTHLNDGRIIEITYHPMSEGGWLATHEDITESKKAEKAMIESEARLRAVFDNSPFCLNLKDAEGRYLFVNKGYEEWYGVTDGIVGKTIKDFHLDPLRAEAVTNIEKMVLETGVPHESEITIRRPKDGKHYDRLLIKFPVKSPDGSIIGLGTFATDITDRKRAEQELSEHRDHLEESVAMATQELKDKADELKKALGKEKELNDIQRQFVSMASHEFRTPLAVIDMTAQRLKRRADRMTPDDTVERADKIRSAVRRMTQLMESTLTAARMEEGKVKVDIRPCNIANVVRKTCECQQEVAKNHFISCDLTNLPETIQADSGALEQVLTNLLSNAVKYAPDAPEIEVRACTEGHEVVISVRDHGLGIDQEELSSIGERFFRAKTSTGIAGTGIGLNLVQMLMGMHDGLMNVESKRGEGSTFTLRLPIAGPSALDREQENSVA